jgi:dihydropyrimidinase
LTAVGGGLRNWGSSSPHAAELAAVQRAIGLCEITGCPIYIVHLSTAVALDACRRARARGLPVHVETRPMYLHLTQSVYERPNPGLYVGQPPVRTQEDKEALWAGLVDGSIDTLGSDHAGWPRDAKLSPSHTLLNPRPGVADLETMLPMLFSEGVHKRGLSLEKFVALTSENAARLFGLYPRKGTIAEGSDADLVVWDPEIERTIDGSRMHSRTGYSPYDGTQVRGFPKWTVRRGEVVLTDDGGVRAEPGSGRLLTRKTHGQ